MGENMNRLIFELEKKVSKDWEGNLNDIGDVIVKLLKKAYDILIILVPITLLVMGTVDLLKATGSNDEKAIARALSSLGKRAMLAVIALVAMLIAKIIFKTVGGGEWNGFF